MQLYGYGIYKICILLLNTYSDMVQLYMKSEHICPCITGSINSLWENWMGLYVIAAILLLFLYGTLVT